MKVRFIMFVMILGVILLKTYWFYENYETTKSFYSIQNRFTGDLPSERTKVTINIDSLQYLLNTIPEYNDIFSVNTVGANLEINLIDTLDWPNTKWERIFFNGIPQRKIKQLSFEKDIDPFVKVSTEQLFSIVQAAELKK